MQNQFSRTELLLGREAMEKLAHSRVAVFGIGGVGGYVCEALVRSGVGAFDLIDDDKVCLTNLNRQIIATRKTVGKYKVDVMKERMLEINPQADIRVHKCFFLPENANDFPFYEYDYMVDAVDTVTAKIELVMKAKEKDIPIISSMGAGNKLDGSQFRVADIYQTRVCPLARVMRRELKKRGVEKLKVVYSEEAPLQPLKEAELIRVSPEVTQSEITQSEITQSEITQSEVTQSEITQSEVGKSGIRLPEVRQSEACQSETSLPEAERRGTARRSVPGSVAFVPSVAGLLLAGEVVKDLIG